MLQMLKLIALYSTDHVYTKTVPLPPSRYPMSPPAMAPDQKPPPDEADADEG